MRRIAGWRTDGAKRTLLLVLSSSIGCAVGCHSAAVKPGARSGADTLAGGPASAEFGHLYPSRLVGAAAASRLADEFGHAAEAVDLGIRATRPIEKLRRELPEKRPMPPLGESTSRALGRAAEALARNDFEGAAAAADAAAVTAPDRPEPVEVQFLVALGMGRPSEVRASMRRLADLDPRNAIPIAFAGLEGVQSGDDEAALSSLAWFVGQDSLPRRGAAVPLPTAAGEIEEQCALAALRLGYPSAALEAVDAAGAALPGDREAAVRLAILRSDALAALGQELDALSALGDASGAESPSLVSRGERSTVERALAILAAFRSDEIRHARGLSADALEDAVGSFERDWTDGSALVRIHRLAPAADEAERRRLSQRIGGVAAAEPLSALHVATARALLQPSEGTAALVRAIGDEWDDRVALRFALRAVARRGVDDAVAVACEAVIGKPNQLDDLVDALLGCGASVESILAALERLERGVAGDAVRSRIHARFGFVEEAFAIADAARGRDRASAAALAACALAAADLGDETLLSEVDDDAISVGNAISRTLSACWLRLGDARRARDRASRALAHDPRDVRAVLHQAESDLDLGECRDECVGRIRAIASGGGTVAGDAYELLSRITDAGAVEQGRDRASGDVRTDSADSGDGRIAVRLPQPPGAVQLLLAAAAELDRTKHPFALECLALAHEIDPGSGASRALISWTKRPGAQAAIGRWADAVLAEAPGLPSSRRIRAALLEPGVSGEIPRGPISARFDSLELASESVRARDLADRAAMRPRTFAATVARAGALLKAGDAAAAAEALDSIADSAPGTLTPRATRQALAVALELASRHPEHGAAAGRFSIEMAVRLVTAGPDDIEDVIRVAIVSRVSQSELEMLATILARASRTGIADARGRFSRLFSDLLAIDGDPFPAARIATALAREARFDASLRGFFGNAAVALQAASGGPAEESIELIRALATAGAPAFVRAEDLETTVATSLLRAASAYSLIGDMVGSDQLLREAIASDPKLAEASNNLAFSRIEVGLVDADTVALAEHAAGLAPDDPAILDTLGVVRYHQGRFRDRADGPGAITLFRQALRVDPDDPSLATLDHLGDALWRDGDQSGAIRCWQQVGQVAKLRYPPEAMARGLAAFQRREFGFELVSPAEFVRREFGRIVERAERKLEEVARGVPPSVAPCLASP